MVKVERIYTSRTDKSSVLKKFQEYSFWNWSEECIIDRYLLGPRFHSECFDLIMCKWIKCFAFHI